MEWFLLLAAAFAAGVVNAIAGGGTLLTFPSLLAVVAPISANGTSTFALLPASLAAAWGYRRELAEVKEHLVRLWPPSLAGGIIGGLLVTRLPERVFSSMVPILLLGATLLLLLQKPIARWIGAHPHVKPTAATLAGVIFFQFLVGIYGGYFGAGIGILMLSSLALVGIPNIHQMNGVKSILAATMNGVSLIIMGLAGAIVWKYALAMAVAASAGGYAGARVARRTKPEYVKWLVIAIGFTMAIYSWLSRR
jgi:uncharacterized membrane protein YfcA